MSNITLDPISAPGLGSGSYGANIKTQFDNIDRNFRQIVEGEYLKGQSGDIVMLEEIDLTDNSHDITSIFKTYIASLQVGDNGIGTEEGCINSPYLYMIYTKNEETGDVVYKSSLPYTFLDPRFNPVSDSAKDKGLEDKSCIIVYDESEKKFKSYNAFPNIYFDGDQNEFCWKINGQKTLLPARGPKGDTGYTGAVYILTANIPDGYNPQDSQSVKVNFLIIPAEYEGWNATNISNDVAIQLKDQAAFVYANYDGNQRIYISQIGTSGENGDIYAVCHLDESCEIHHVFANQTLKDVLTEVKPESDFNYLFIPSKFENSELKEAHVVTTKRSGDDIIVPQHGFWWPEYTEDDWKGLNDPNICIISPATIGSTTRTLNKSMDNPGILYNNYKFTICPGGGYFGRLGVGSVQFTNVFNQGNGQWNINGMEGKILEVTYLNGSTTDKPYVNLTNSALLVDKDLTVQEDLSVNGNAAITKDLSVGGKTITNNLYYSRNNVVNPWVTLNEPIPGMTHFPNPYYNKSSELNEIYNSGVQFAVTISIGQKSLARTFKKSLGLETVGYDVMLNAVARCFTTFINECKNANPSNPSYQWNADTDITGGAMHFKYDGDIFELKNPEDLIIKVTAPGFELTNSYNPKEFAKANTIKITGNVETPGNVKASDLILGGQKIDDKINDEINSAIRTNNENFLIDYFAETNTFSGQGATYPNSINKYGEKLTILNGYRYPVQIWESVCYSYPLDCHYEKTNSPNVNAHAAKYIIEMDLTGVENWITHIHFQTAFNAIGSANNNEIIVHLDIKDVHGNLTAWEQTRSFVSGINKIDTHITFKNNSTQVSDFTRVS